ncbi:MAG: hypothetical protein KBS59_00485 [Clostridiales bacterium]|nr:hypothetical protein [Clostridiales bacterium]
MAKIKNPLTLITGGSDNAEVIFRTAVSGATTFSVVPSSPKNSFVMVRLDDFVLEETAAQSFLAVYVNGSLRKVSSARARHSSEVPYVSVSNETGDERILTVSALEAGYNISATRVFGAGKRYAFFFWNEEA